MKKFITLLMLLGLGAFMFGCASNPSPTPDMTRMGAGGAGTGSGNWVDEAGSGSSDLSPTDLGGYGTGSGLSQRPTGFQRPPGAPENLYVSVYFDFDRSFIRDTERGNLSQTAQYLLENPDTKLLIEGHCDWKGTTDYNLALGDRRANSVKSYLIELGVAATRIEVLSKGDLEAQEGAGDELRKMDRRADLLLL